MVVVIKLYLFSFDKFKAALNLHQPLSLVDDEDGEDRVTDTAKYPHAFLEICYGFFSSFAENLC